MAAKFSIRSPTSFSFSVVVPDRAARFASPAPVRRKTRESHSFHHQREVAQPPGLGRHLGRASGPTRGHRQERARPVGQVGLGLLAGAAGPPVRVFPVVVVVGERQAEGEASGAHPATGRR